MDRPVKKRHGTASVIANGVLPLVIGQELIKVASKAALWVREVNRKGNVGSKVDAEAKLSHQLRASGLTLGRISMWLAALEVTTRNVRSVSKLRLAILAGALQDIFAPFSWTFSLHIFLLSAAKLINIVAARKSRIPWTLTPAGVYLSHFLHNYIMINGADLFEASYIQLWLLVLPGYRWRSDFISHFGSQSSDYYEESQVARSRLAKIIPNIFVTFKSHLPIISIIFLSKTFLRLKFASKSAKSILLEVLGSVRAQTIPIFRSAALLAFLPYVVTDFPCVYARCYNMIFPSNSKSDNVKLIRKPRIFHVILCSIISTLFFMIEPIGRRNVLVVYTWWRILESYGKRALGKIGFEKQLQSFLSSALIGSAASIMKTIEPGNC